MKKNNFERFLKKTLFLVFKKITNALHCDGSKIVMELKKCEQKHAFGKIFNRSKMTFASFFHLQYYCCSE
jgi:hypothetical protein